MKLCGKSLSRIIEFVLEVKKNTFVEAIYCLCTQEGNIVNWSVFTIYSRSLCYGGPANSTVNEREKIQQLTTNFNMQSEVVDNEFVKFYEGSSWDYTLTMMHRREMMAIQRLVSGKILFDRFGKYTEMREKAINGYGIPPFKDTFDIDNLTSNTPNDDSTEVITESTEKGMQLI